MLYTIAALFIIGSLAVWHWNTALFHLINGHNSATLDHLFGLTSGLGDGLVAVVIIMLVTLYRTRVGCSALLAFLLSGLVAQLLKRLFDMPRPPALLEGVHLLGSPLQSHSFPSGHATTDGVMATAALLLWRDGSTQQRTAGAAAALLFLLAAIGRVYGGVHFPQDVWAGASIGVATMLLCWRWSDRWPTANWQHQRWWLPVTGMLLALLAAILGLGYRVQPATAQALALMVPLVALFLLTKRWGGAS
ncbi:MAG: phosphatase PAP2 family protein [Mariprofundales bacterium]|nr:phosphatase PAP2 family protein [Mariprofundales bacterium]